MMSPCAMPSSLAFFSLISTQLHHIPDVIGSGVSCSQGRWACDPSYSICDAYGMKKYGYTVASPSKAGSVHATGCPVTDLADEGPFAGAFKYSSNVFGRPAIGFA